MEERPRGHHRQWRIGPRSRNHDARQSADCRVHAHGKAATETQIRGSAFPQSAPLQADHLQARAQMPRLLFLGESAMTRLSGKVSWFGGPADTGVSPDEGLAFIYDVEDAPYLFLAEQPPDTTGLARRLNPETYYIACRWDYDIT